MSLTLTARRAARANDATALAVPASDAADGGKQLVDSLMTLVPGEAVVPTVTLFGALSAYGWGPRAGVVALGVLLCIGYTWLAYLRACTTAEARRRLPVAAIATTTVAFLVWTSSAPGNPLAYASWWSASRGALAVLFGGAAAVLLGLARQIRTLQTTPVLDASNAREGA